MRFLFANINYDIGGFSTFSINMAQAFRGKGHHVSLVVCQPYGDLLNDFKSNFDNIIVLKRGLKNKEQYVQQVALTINKHKPHMVIINSVAEVLAALPNLSEDTVTVSVVHSIGPFEISLALANREYNNSLVVVSENIAEIINSQYNYDVNVIPVGVQCPDTVRRVEELHDPVRLIFVGRLSPEKNLPVLFMIINKLNKEGISFTLTIVGDGTEKRNIIRLKEQSLYPERFTLTGTLSRQEIARQYLLHDVLLLTSIREGTPHSVLEAMAHGVIPVCSNLRGSTDRIINNGETGYLCETHQIEQYVAAIRELINSPALYQSIAQKTQQVVRKLYDIDHIADRYLALYEICINRKALMKPRKPNGKPKVIPPELTLLFSSYWLQLRSRLSRTWHRNTICSKIFRL